MNYDKYTYLPESATEITKKHDQPDPPPRCTCQRVDVPAKGWRQLPNGKWTQGELTHDYPRTNVLLTYLATCKYGNHATSAGEERLIDFWKDDGVN